jgi:hypothetical protein
MEVLLLAVIYGGVWGLVWGGLDAIMEIKGFLSNGTPLQQILRSVLAMFLASFAVSIVFGLFGLAMGSNLISLILALVVSIYFRPYVLSRWRW